MSTTDKLAEALRDAATSLETIARLAGKKAYAGDSGERIPTYMEHHDEVRSYARARAEVARAALAAYEAEAKPAPADALTQAVDAAMVEMKNIHPPLRRSECQRLIQAALNAAPAAPAPADPLTWEQFVAACELEYGEDFAPEEMAEATDDEKKELLRVVRMVERAHGICKGGEA